MKVKRIYEHNEIERDVIKMIYARVRDIAYDGKWRTYEQDFAYNGKELTAKCKFKIDNQMLTYKNLEITHKQKTIIIPQARFLN